jgi:hypothetical protein
MNLETTEEGIMHIVLPPPTLSEMMKEASGAECVRARAKILMRFAEVSAIYVFSRSKPC